MTADWIPPLDGIAPPLLLVGELVALGPAHRGLMPMLWKWENDLELSLLQIQRNVGDLMVCAREGGYPEADLMLRTRRDQVMASERAVRAISVVMQSPGQEADEVLMERVWRDVATARMHVSSNVEQVLSVVGRFAFGLTVDDLIW